MLFDVLFFLLAVFLLIPVSLLFFQIISALKCHAPSADFSGKRPRVAVLVPAHNESQVIGQTIHSILPQLLENDRLLVVADNCSDDTATLAKNAGAEVVERHDTDRRGKGFALDYGVRYLKADSPDVVVVVDADCQMTEGSIEILGLQCVLSGRPVQALNLMKATDPDNIRMKIAEFAWRVKNWVRPLGSASLGVPCQLFGTGMAFPWALLNQVELASGNIVEDMQLGLDCALAGYPPKFCPAAQVTSFFPETSSAVVTQRTRWEHGHLSTILQHVPKLMVQGLKRRNLHLVWMALDLAVPPLVLLLLLIGMTFLLSLTGIWLGFLSEIVFLTAGISVALSVFALLLAWFKWGKDILGYKDLLAIPGYIFSKFSIYLQFLTRRQKEWVRTKRD